MSRISKLQRLFGLLLMIFSTLALFGIVYLSAPVKVIDLKSLELCDRYGNPTNTVTSGQSMFYKLKYRNYKPLMGSMTLQIVNKFMLSYPVYVINLPVLKKEAKKSDYQSIIFEVKLPDTSISGEHYINMVMIYRINFLNTVTKSISSKEFEIIKSNKKSIPANDNDNKTTTDIPISIYTLNDK